MTYRYAVVGAGRQGTAAAYDLAVHGDASRLVLADASAERARAAAERVNGLAVGATAEAVEVDATDVAALTDLLRSVDVAVCATPFALIPVCTEAAIAAPASMVDLGGHTPTVLSQLSRTAEAAEAGIVIVPDCGMGPGMNNTLGLYAMELLEAAGWRPTGVRLYDGGLPQDRSAPWGYRLFFDIEGLTNEYDGDALVLRRGEVTRVPALTEPETLSFPELGTLEAFVTSGGTSTVPYSLAGRLDVYENKTLRYPGHLVRFAAFKELGLFSEDPVQVPGAGRVVPRHLFHALLGPRLGTGPVEDICVMRSVGVGGRGEETATVTVDLIDLYDADTRFTAMERLTGFHAAIMAGFLARGEVAPGVVALERAVPAGRFLAEARRRGFHITERWS